MTGLRVIRLDGAARTPVHERAREAAARAADAAAGTRGESLAHPSVRGIVDAARKQVASAVNAGPEDVVFAPGLDAAHRMALSVAAPGSVLVATPLEHRSVFAAAEDRSLGVAAVPVDATGRVDPDLWFARVAGRSGPKPALASLHHGGHHVGTIQPLAECAAMARQAGALVHSDASQSVQSLPLDVRGLGVDVLTLDGGTAYALPGTAAVVGGPGLRPPAAERWADVGSPAGIAALGAALEALACEVRDLAARLWKLTGRFRAELDRGARVLGHPTHRVPHLVSFAVPESDPATLLALLERRGVVMGSVDAAPLVEAGMVEAGSAVLRLGVTRETTDADADRALDVVLGVLRDWMLSPGAAP